MNARAWIFPLLVVLMAADVPNPFQEGERLFGEKQYAEALQQFERANNEIPEDPVIHSWLSACLLQLGKPEEAEAKARAAIEFAKKPIEGQEPAEPNFHYYQALASTIAAREMWVESLAVYKDYQSAAKTVDAATHEKITTITNQTFARALTRAKESLQRSDFDRALYHLAQAEQIKPGDRALVETRAVATLNYALKADEADRAKRYEAAVTTARAWVATDAESAKAKRVLARALMGAKQPAEAADLLAALSAAEPTDCAIKVELTRAHAILADWEKLKGSASDAVACNPADLNSRFLLCLATAKVANEDETIAKCDEYVAQGGDNAKLVESGIDIEQMKADAKARADQEAYRRRMTEWAEKNVKKPGQ